MLHLPVRGGYVQGREGIELLHAFIPDMKVPVLLLRLKGGEDLCHVSAEIRVFVHEKIQIIGVAMGKVMSTECRTAGEIERQRQPLHDFQDSIL
jgi:hypothetical protein